MQVTNGSREWESRMGVVAKVSRGMRSQMGVRKWGRQKLKIGGICKWDPEGSN